MPKQSRNTTVRDRHRRIIAQGNPPCAHCGEPIDYQAHHLNPLAFQIDHVTPLDRGGTDTLDNLVPAHRKCNRDKSNKPASWTPGVQYVTERTWTP